MKKFLFMAVMMTFVAIPAMAQSFGSATAVSGDQIIAGGRTSPLGPGILYTFGRKGSDWSETGSIMASDTENGDGFGHSVSVSGSTMIVGATGSKSAYFFTKNDDGSWTESGRVGVDENNFGASVAISGDLALVGVARFGRRRGGGGGAATIGTVYAYHKSATGEWTLNGTLAAEGVEAGSGYGIKLAIDGMDAVVGAPGANNRTGAVYAFRYDSDAGQWTPNGSPTNPAMGEGSSFGSAIFMIDGHLAVGSPGFERRTGSATVFTLNDEGEWTLSERIAPFSASGGEGFGSSFGWADNSLWVGAPGANGRQGVIYRFGGDEDTDRLTSTWVKKGMYLQPSSGFGSSIAINEEIGVIGASGHDRRSGVIFPLALNGDDWVQGGAKFRDPPSRQSITGGMLECDNDHAGAFPCKDVNMEAFLSLKDMGGDRGIGANDIWGWEDSESGHEYAIVGLNNQTSFVDITDPLNPVYLGKLPMTSTAKTSVWRDMKVYKDHVFIVSDGAGEHGMQVFDLRQLRNISNPPLLFEETVHYPGIFSAHNIVINEESGFAYVVGSSSGGETCGGGLHMINIQDPDHPTFAGCFADGSTGRRGTGYSHDAECVMYHGPDSDYQGHEICLGSNETALSIADVTDKKNPLSISIATYPKVAYAHQGWLTEDQTYFFMGDEGDEGQGLVDGTRTLVWDLSDLDDPELVNEYIATTKDTDHNMYVKGNLMYQSNYGAGFRVLDVSDPVHPVEVGYFKMGPEGASGSSWSNYPFFKSGTIIATDMGGGLFVLKKKDVDI